MASHTKKNSPLSYHTYLFEEGTDSRAYEFLGAHPERRAGLAGAVFRVWAPAARSVSVTGDFNGWDRSRDCMKRLSGGIWERFIPGVRQFDSYKYSVETKSGQIFDKADPYAFHAETRPGTASKVYPLSGYEWNDASWRNYCLEHPVYESPLNIYELHAGSWRRGAHGEFLSYGQLADQLIPYVKQMGYTHIELMPVLEHPLDASWGYQVTGYFAPTSRYGTPWDFMSFVDRCHQAGVGVILDWVPAHFPKDGHGLCWFDGTYLYEYSDILKREHPDWGTLVFDFGRPQVRSFLMSSALFWLDKYHVDGLRVDAVASMLYLDYGRKPGQWRPNVRGGRENLEAVELLRGINQAVFAAFPSALMIAEESTAWPMVTKPTHIGGLGFNLKWNMGWVNDMLHYTGLDPIARQYNHKDITFSFMYAFSENFVLPVSHDEVVHGKYSLLSKMPGSYEEKFAGVRVFCAYMMGHPGKKHLFMGAEIGQFIEWDENKELDWLLLDYDMHRKLMHFFERLNAFYLENEPLWQLDFSWEGFEWLCQDDAQSNFVAFLRRDKKGNELVVCANFSPVLREGYRLGVPEAGVYEEVFSTDCEQFGGLGRCGPKAIQADAQPWHGRTHSVALTLPPLGAVFLRRQTPAAAAPDTPCLVHTAQDRPEITGP